MKENKIKNYKIAIAREATLVCENFDSGVVKTVELVFKSK